ncbi:hypothetical protein IQ266_17855 [filamentous cyanobacterium LEGE 11480]|uniref:Uncharacterized protein n=1 Tax=Romeriopsis navalis LEGE 11480 TaxID=2777977 RepID=A0A928VRF9_9CYAN|nr:hypothetical protein [Romeriopsis navalis]MBE9031601.1 hypothetical protein [Romeriopsis navalis LEGE 11480]
MFKLDIPTITSLGSFLIGVGSTSFAAWRLYDNAQRKKFAAEREFNHLKRGNDQLKIQVVDLDKKVDELTAVTVELRGAVSILIDRQCKPELNAPTLKPWESL